MLKYMSVEIHSITEITLTAIITQTQIMYLKLFVLSCERPFNVL